MILYNNLMLGLITIQLHIRLSPNIHKIIDQISL
jgi:hypothetical protein